MNEKFVSKNYPYIFMVPAIVIFTLFFILPAIFGLGLSLTDASVRSQEVAFVGLENYKRLFSTDGVKFIKSISNQFRFALTVTLSKTFIGLILALILDKAFKGRNALRALVYMPIMFSPAVIGIIFNYILRYDGLLNTILRNIGLGFLAQDWFGNFDLALFSVAGVDTWIGVGWSMLLILAALQSVPQELLECADIDGANGRVKFFKVKLPFIFHAINMALLLTVISGLKAFDIIYATTGGGPGYSTEVMTTFIAKTMSSGSLGYPAAASFCQFVVITVVAFIINSILAKREVRL